MLKKDSFQLYKLHLLEGGLEEIALEGEGILLEVALALEVVVPSFVMAHDVLFDTVACHVPLPLADLTFVS